jgi:hypothetical protein
MGVDMLQSFGVSPMIVDQAGTVIWVRWYKCQPGALPYPGDTCFASPINENRKLPVEGPRVLFGGEQRPPTESPYPGLHFEGDPQWFLTGLPGPPPVNFPPALCGVPVLGAQGGALVGGTGFGNQRLIVATMHEATALVGSAFNPRNVQGTMAEATALTGSAFNPRNVQGTMAEATALTGSAFNPRNVQGTMAEATALTGSAFNPRNVQGTMAEATSLVGSTTFNPGGNPIIFGCSSCPGGSYTYWTLTVSGVTGSSDCTAHNGTFRLTYSGSGCQWLSDAEFSPGRPLWQFELVGFTTWELVANDSLGNTQAQWRLTSGYNCLAPNTFNTFNVSACGGWPSTVTVSPS